MPNPMRGEAPLGEHKLVVDFNGWCSLEAATGKKVPELLNEMKAGLGFADLRTWVRIFLSEPMSAEDVGNLIGAHYEETIKSMSVAIEGFFSPKKEEEARPRKAA